MEGKELNPCDALAGVRQRFLTRAGEAVQKHVVLAAVTEVDRDGGWLIAM
jgi:hypothetical protein